MRRSRPAARAWSRLIGVTGHGRSIPKMHSRSLERFDSTPCCARTTSSRCRTRATRRRSTSCRATVRRARRRAADHQEPRPRAVGGPRAHRGDLVRAAHRAGRHRPRRPLGARQPAGVLLTTGDSTCCRSCSTPRSATNATVLGRDGARSTRAVVHVVAARSRIQPVERGGGHRPPEKVALGLVAHPARERVPRLGSSTPSATTAFRADGPYRRLCARSRRRGRRA